MKKVLLALLFVAAALLGFGAGADTVKIGVILPLTGDNAQVGQPQLAAVEMFKKELEANHYKHKYQLIVEDDQFVPRKTAEAAKKLLYVDKVDAIMTHGIAPGLAMAPLAGHLGIPHICINASNMQIGDDKTNFVHWPATEEEADKLITLLEKMGGKRIAFLADQHPGITKVIKIITAKAKEHNFEVVEHLTFNSGERDFRTMMAIIRDKKPDIFIPFAISPEIDIILRQRKQAGLDCKVTTFEVINFMSDKTPANVLYYTSPSIGTPEFQARLKALTGQESGYCVAYAYDALALFRAAYEQQDKIDHAAAAKWIAGLKDYPSAVGSITTDTTGLIHSTVGIFQIQNGRPVEVTIEQVK